jgi:hypothetical protein
VSVDGANGDWWYLDFVPSAGDILAPGTYSGATRYPFNGTGAGLSIDGEGRGCNELTGAFTVNELTFDGAGPRTLSISFEQHCEHATPALRGTFELRAGDTSTPAPWMVAGATVPIGTPPGGPAPGPAPAMTSIPSAPAPAPVATAATTASPVAIARNRVAVSTRALLTAAAKLNPKTAAQVRLAANRLAADLARYQAALKATPASRARTAAVEAVDRQVAAVRRLRSALTRYARASGRRAAARTIAKAAKSIAAAERSAARAARTLG